MPKLTNSFVSEHGLDMRTEIRRERTIELYNEGFRLDDLKRWKTAETEMPQDILGVKWKGTEYETTWSKCPHPRMMMVFWFLKPDGNGLKRITCSHYQKISCN